MSKLKLKNILSELLKEIDETHPIHKKINDKLMQIAKRGYDAEEKEDGKNVKKVNEVNGIKFSKDDLIWYLDRLDPQTRVNIPTIYPKKFSSTESTQLTAQNAIRDLKNTNLKGNFELWVDLPHLKKFSLIQSPEELKSIEKVVRNNGKLD